MWIKNEEEWIKNLKISDKVYQIEYHNKIPNGSHSWKGIVTLIESNYIEVKWTREPTDWLEDARREMKKGSSNNFDRTYFENWTKNYFDPNGKINILQMDNKS